MALGFSWFRSIAEIIGAARRGRPYVAQHYLSHFGPVSMTEARRNATVVACCNLIARGIAQLTFSAPDVGPNSAAARVLRKPNLWQTPYEFWHSQAFDLMLWGNALSQVFRGSGVRDIRAMAPLDPDDVRLRSNEAGAPVYILDQDGTELSAMDAIHTRDGGSHDPWAPSRLESAGKRVRLLIAADELINSTFVGGINAQHAYMTEQELVPEQIAARHGELARLFGPGGSRRGGVAILDGGAKLERLASLTPADTDLRELREDIKREIAASWSVPPFLIGAAGDAKYANFTASVLTLYRDTYVPVSLALCQRYSEALGTRVVCNHKELLRGDLAAQITNAVNASGGPVSEPERGAHGAPGHAGARAGRDGRRSRGRDDDAPGRRPPRRDADRRRRDG